MTPASPASSSASPALKRTTQLTPLEAVLDRYYPERTIPWKRLTRVCTLLLKAYPAERVASELDGYLRQTPIQFVNWDKFAMGFGTWVPKNPPSRYRTADECDRAAGLL